MFIDKKTNDRIGNLTVTQDQLFLPRIGEHVSLDNAVRSEFENKKLRVVDICYGYHSSYTSIAIYIKQEGEVNEYE